MWQYPSKHGTMPMLFQCWASVEGFSSTLKQDLVNNMCLLMCWCKLYSRPSVKLMLGQHRRRLTVIERAMGCDAGPTLNRNWVGIGLHRVYVCRYMRQPDSLAIQILNRCWPAPAMVVEGVHVEDIF